MRVNCTNNSELAIVGIISYTKLNKEKLAAVNYHKISKE